MNKRLRAWTKGSYPDSKSDLFAMFIERNLKLAVERGLVAMITMHGWMFLSRYKKLRTKLLKHSPIQNLAHLGANAFDSIGGEVVSTTAFVLQNSANTKLIGQFIDLRKEEMRKKSRIRFRKPCPVREQSIVLQPKISETITGSPIVYWLPPAFQRNFRCLPTIKAVFKPATGFKLATTTDFCANGLRFHSEGYVSHVTQSQRPKSRLEMVSP